MKKIKTEIKVDDLMILFQIAGFLHGVSYYLFGDIKKNALKYSEEIRRIGDSLKKDL